MFLDLNPKYWGSKSIQMTVELKWAQDVSSVVTEDIDASEMFDKQSSKLHIMSKRI